MEDPQAPRPIIFNARLDQARFDRLAAIARHAGITGGWWRQRALHYAIDCCFDFIASGSILRTEAENERQRGE